MVNQNCWITTLLVKKHKYYPPLTKAIKCDVLIVGADSVASVRPPNCLRKGLSVVRIEKNIVGGSSSGRSADFLTPETADKTTVAVDKLTLSISPLANEAFHVQTFLSVTEPPNERNLRTRFPSGSQYSAGTPSSYIHILGWTGHNPLLPGTEGTLRLWYDF